MTQLKKIKNFEWIEDDKYFLDEDNDGITEGWYDPVGGGEFKYFHYDISILFRLMDVIEQQNKMIDILNKLTDSKKKTKESNNKPIK